MGLRLGPGGILLAAVLLLPAVPAVAQDAFEIQVYDSDTAARGTTGLELHVNDVIAGGRTAAPPELPSLHVAHFTLEPHLGIASWGEVGAYLQSALRPDGDLDYAGAKLRLKVRIPHRLRGVVGLALNAEILNVPAAYEAARLGSELRPIVDLRLRWLYASVNPIMTVDLRGPERGRPMLEPAAKLGARASQALMLGAEYYAVLGPLSGLAAPANQVHRVFGALDWAWSVGALHGDLNLGGGYAFGPGPRVIAKAIVGFSFGKG